MNSEPEIVRDIVYRVAENIPEMVTIKEAARRTGVSYDFIRKLCLQNKIVYVKAGSKYLVNFGKFCEYLDEGEQKGATSHE